MKVTQTLEQLQRALQHPNVRAWLRLIRAGESHASDPDAYYALYGWHPGNLADRFHSLATHPRTPRQLPDGRWTSAAGAYQFMAAVPGFTKIDTWGECARWFAAHGYTLTFSAADQDLAAVWATARRGALPAVIDGQIVLAMHMCRQEWASLPGSPYGQPTRAAEALLAVYHAHGGTLADKTSPPATPAQPEGTAMPGPITASVLGGLAATVIDAFVAPKLKAEIARHTAPEVAAQLATAVVDATKQVTGLDDPVAAVAAVRAEPERAAQVEQIVAADLERMAPLLERITALDLQRFDAEEASRQAAEERARSGGRDQDQFLTRSIVWLMVGLLVGSGMLVVTLAALEVADAVLVAALNLLTAGGMLAIAKFGTRYDHRYGSSAGSSAKDSERDALVRRLMRGQS